MFFEWWRLLCCGAGVEYKNVFEAGVFSFLQLFVQCHAYSSVIKSCVDSEFVRKRKCFEMLPYISYAIFLPPRIRCLFKERKKIFVWVGKDEIFLCIVFRQFFSIFDKVFYFTRNCRLQFSDVLNEMW